MFFWNQLEKWLENSIGFKIKFTVLKILLGFYYIDKKNYYILNYLIIYGKYYIFQCRSNHKSLFSFYVVILLIIKDRLTKGVVGHAQWEKIIFGKKYSAFPVILTPLSRQNFVLWVEPLYIFFQGGVRTP